MNAEYLLILPEQPLEVCVSFEHFFGYFYLNHLIKSQEINVISTYG